MKTVIFTFVNLVVGATFALVMVAAYTAYTSPIAVTKVICHVKTDNYVDYAKCIFQNNL